MHLCPDCGKDSFGIMESPIRDYSIDAHELELPTKRYYICHECLSVYVLETPKSILRKIRKPVPPRYKKV